MRLTLRTLIAYLDGVLSPQDAADLERKIGESDYAQQLVHRIRSIVEQPRMEAPRLETTSTVADANWMAEYLDSTLDPEQVTRLERLCLESDASLAEAVSCHTILSHEVRQSVRVSGRLKRRLINLGITTETPPTTPGSPGGWDRRDDAHAPKATATMPSDRRVSPETTPAREPSANAMPSDPESSTAALEGATAVQRGEVAAIASKHGTSSALDTGALDFDSPTSSSELPVPPDWVDRRPASPAVAWLALTVSCLALLLVATLAMTGRLPHPFASPRNTAQRQGAIQPESTAQPLDARDTSGSSSPETTESPPTTAATLPDSLNAPSTASAPQPTGRDQSPPADPVTGGPTTTLPSQPSEAAATGTAQGGARIARLSDSGVSGPNAQPTTTKPRPALPSPQPPRQLPVTLATPDAFVATWDEAREAWVWAPTQRELTAPLILQQFGTSAANWELPDAPSITVPGSARYDLREVDLRPLDPAAGTTLGIELRRGTLLLSADGVPGQSLAVETRHHRWLITLLDADSRVALRVWPYRAPGQVPTQNASVEVTQVIGLAGQSQLRDASGLKLLPPQTAMTFHDGRSFQSGPIDALPEWSAGRTQLNEFAAAQWARRVDRQQEVVASLAAWINHERPELRMTAVESLVQLGVYEPLLPALNDPRNRANWRRRLMELAQDKLAYGPPGTDSLVRHLEQDPEIGPLLLTIWTGYSTEQLAAGAASTLVNALEHDSLAVRAAAFEQLLAITGSSELYVPDADPTLRNRRVQAWRARLEAGRIQYLEPPKPPQLAYHDELR